MVCLYLNARNALIKKETISIGLLNKSLLHPREVFHPAVELNASTILFIPPPPSGNLNPSNTDSNLVPLLSASLPFLVLPVPSFILLSCPHPSRFPPPLPPLPDIDYIKDGEQLSLFNFSIISSSCICEMFASSL